jgi:hypothetical protein
MNPPDSDVECASDRSADRYYSVARQTGGGRDQTRAPGRMDRGTLGRGHRCRRSAQTRSRNRPSASFRSRRTSPGLPQPAARNARTATRRSLAHSPPTERLPPASRSAQNAVTRNGRSVSSPLPGSHPAPASTTPPGGPPPLGGVCAPELHLRLLAGKARLQVPGSARGSMCVPPYASEASSRPRQMRGQAGRGVGGDRRSNGPGRSACIRGRGTPARNCSAMLAGLRGLCSSSRLEHHASARCGQSRGAVLAHPVPPLGAAPRSHVARVGVSRCAPTRRRGRPPASGRKRSWQIR